VLSCELSPLGGLQQEGISPLWGVHQVTRPHNGGERICLVVRFIDADKLQKLEARLPEWRAMKAQK
jgi:hypothetical protein